MNRATSATGWVRNPDGTLGWTWNPLTGCLNHVSGLCKGGGFPCYAYKLANGRLKQRYLANNLLAPRINFSAYDDPFYPRFWEERLLELPNNVIAGKERGIFVCDMGDLFGIGVPGNWTRQIIERIKGWPEYRFYLLTKQPQNLPREFPDNCWVGVTATNWLMFSNALGELSAIKANVKYISFEPLLERIQPDELQTIFLKCGVLDWFIIGACTGTGIEMLRLAEAYKREDGSVMPYGNKFTLQPKIEWVQEIVEAADKAGVKVFLKDNLWPLLTGHPEFWEDIPQGNHPNYESIAELRQEMPTDGV